METHTIRPVVTEKTLELASRGWFTFRVPCHARKEEIRAAISLYYHVDCVDARTLSMHGKMRRAGKRSVRVKQPDWKKALVKLKEGQKIDAFQVATQEEAKHA